MQNLCAFSYVCINSMTANFTCNCFAATNFTNNKLLLNDDIKEKDILLKKKSE